MYRYLVIFRSHHDALADVHYVDMSEASPLAAIAKALKERPPVGDWAFVRALAWPRGCTGVEQAAKKYATKR